MILNSKVVFWIIDLGDWRIDSAKTIGACNLVGGEAEGIGSHELMEGVILVLQALNNESEL